MKFLIESRHCDPGEKPHPDALPDGDNFFMEFTTMESLRAFCLEQQAFVFFAPRGNFIELNKRPAGV